MRKASAKSITKLDRDTLAHIDPEQRLFLTTHYHNIWQLIPVDVQFACLNDLNSSVNDEEKSPPIHLLIIFISGNGHTYTVAAVTDSPQRQTCPIRHKCTSALSTYLFMLLITMYFLINMNTDFILCNIYNGIRLTFLVFYQLLIILTY